MWRIFAEFPRVATPSEMTTRTRGLLDLESVREFLRGRGPVTG